MSIFQLLTNRKDYPMASKITGKPVYTGHGFKIYVGPPTSPKKSKPRIWISIRQDDPKEWRVYETLSYANGTDVAFVKK